MRWLGILLLLSPLARADEDLAARTLAAWDTNGDGVLTKDEFPDDATFKKADRDQDGKVTREEVAIYLGLVKAPPPPPPKDDAKDEKKDGKKDGKKPETESAGKPAPKPPAPEKPAKRGESVSDGGVKKQPFTVPERVEDFFRRFDRDQDRRVDKKEAQGIAPEMWERFDRNKDDAFSIREATRYIRFQLEEARKNPTRANFFELYDRNRDKRVTKAEYDGPSAFFRSYDHDRDRVVTEDELNMGPNAMRENPRQMEADEEFMADGRTKAPERSLLDRYDQDGDGRITLEELNGAEALMQRLDRNGDGVLSGREAR